MTNYRESWKYNWVKDGGDLAKNIKLEDFNRVLIIQNAQMEDQGTYTCRVNRGNIASDQKSLTLRLEGSFNYLFYLLLSCVAFLDGPP